MKPKTTVLMAVLIYCAIHENHVPGLLC